MPLWQNIFLTLKTKIMKRMVTNSLIAILMILLCTKIIAQDYDTEIVQKCPLIVEAKVVEQEYRYDPENSDNIQTLNYLKISEYLKGSNFTNRIAIVTEGGIIDDMFQTVSHVPKLSIGQKGIFFLEPLQNNNVELIAKLYNGEDRKLLYISDLDHEVYCTHTHNYYESKGLLKQEVSQNSVEFIESELSESELCLRIENIQPDLINSKVRFDVKIKANAPGYRFSELSLDFAYPTKNLDKYIATNGNLNLSRGTVIQDEFYNLNFVDVDTSQVSVRITTDCNSGSSVLSNDYYVLSTNYEKLFTAEVNVAEWGSYGELTIESFDFDGRAKYAVSDGRCVDFNNLCAEDDGFEFKNCSITSFEVAPFGAGVQQIMSIKGMCFSTAGELKIPNADDGGASKITIQSTDTRWIKSWTDTEIRVLVSSLAPGDHPMGSGEWEVHPDIHMMCMDAVDVEYAIGNTFVNNEERMTSIAHSPFAGNQSFEWYLDELAISTNTSLISQGITLSDIRDVCEAAFCDWETATNIEFEYMGNNSNGASPTDQKYTVTIGALSGNVRAITKNQVSQNSDCEDTDPFIDGRLLDSDITFDEATKWFVSTNTSGIAIDEHDFYSVISHEIGHMIMLKHSCDIPLNSTGDDRIMYFELNSSDQKRTIDVKTLNGIEVQKTRTISANSGCQSGFDLNTSISGCTTSVIDFSSTSNFSVYPNPIADNEIHIKSSKELIKSITLFSINGQLLYTNTNIDSYQYNFSMSLEAGVYLVKINGYVESKIIVL